MPMPFSPVHNARKFSAVFGTTGEIIRMVREVAVRRCGRNTIIVLGEVSQSIVDD